MASAGTSISSGSNAEVPLFFYKGGKKPQEVARGDGTLVVVNSTTGAKFSEHQLKTIINKSKQSAGIDKRVERMRQKLQAKTNM